MKDGAVLLVRADPSERGFAGFVARMIEWRTGSDKTHVIGYVDGLYYDDTINLTWRPWPHLVSGVRVRTNVWGDELETLEPTKALDERETAGLAYWCHWYAERDYHYSIWHLVAFLLIYPTRGLWKRLGIVPFRRSINFVCSTFWAMALEVVDRQVRPGVDPTEIVPGDFDSSLYFQRPKEA